MDGDIKEIGNSELQTLDFNLNEGNVYGNLESLTNKISLTNLVLGTSNIEGTIETMLDQMATQRNSGTLNIVTNRIVFYQGIQHSARIINVTFSDGGWSVS